MDQSFRFLLATLAVWRITHLLVHEDGPWDLVARLREQLGQSFWGRLMDCFKCLSVWIAIPFAWFVGGGWIQELVVWLALSGGAILLEGRLQEPVFLGGGEQDGLLRQPESAGSASETSSTESGSTESAPGGTPQSG
jgi:hypothetical protein